MYYGWKTPLHFTISFCILAFSCISYNSTINTQIFKCPVEIYPIDVNPIEAYLISKGIVEVFGCHLCNFFNTSSAHIYRSSKHRVQSAETSSYIQSSLWSSEKIYMWIVHECDSRGLWIILEEGDKFDCYRNQNFFWFTTFKWVIFIQNLIDITYNSKNFLKSSKDDLWFLNKKTIMPHPRRKYYIKTIVNVS